MRGIWAFICLCLLSTNCAAGFSGSNSTGLSRFEQRELYKEAIAHIKSGRRSAYLKLRDELIDYPLYPYLEYTDKIYRISRQTPQDIDDFVSRYDTTPLSDRLLENWVWVQAEQNNWARFLEYYKPELAGSRNGCNYATALYKEGRIEEAFAETKKLWLVNYSQPDECDTVFKAWRDAGRLDRESAWQRFSMTLRSGEQSLASYLTRYLDPADVDMANHMRLLARSGNYVRQKQRFGDNNERTREVLVYGIRRLAVSEPEIAFELFEQYTASHQFSVTDINDTWAYIGIRLAVDDDPNHLLDQVPVDLHEYPELTEARIRLALRQLDWSTALIMLNVLPEEEQAEPRWQYWKARILSGSADAADRDVATTIYREIAKLRNFYGFLAADSLGVIYDFEDSPAIVTNEEVLSLEATPGIQRALELFTLGERYRARSEWYHTTSEFTDHELQIAARVAQKWGWYRQAIRAMIDAEAWDDLNVRFPLAYQDAFVSNARVWDIPLNWSFAIARQESAFMPDARSSAGAMGIMQLMPATARLTANRHGVTYDSNDELHNPLMNIQLGSAYLGRMLRRFNNNRIIASAAYNAGPGRAEKWMNPSLPVDVWIETIPFTETRGYVQNVLMFAAIYARRMSLDEPLIYAHELKDFSNQQVTLRPPAPIVRPDNS